MSRDKLNANDGERDVEFPHIVRFGNEIHCFNCGNWNDLSNWLDFVNHHKNCRLS